MKSFQDITRAIRRQFENMESGLCSSLENLCWCRSREDADLLRVDWCAQFVGITTYGWRHQARYAWMAPSAIRRETKSLKILSRRQTFQSFWYAETPCGSNLFFVSYHYAKTPASTRDIWSNILRDCKSVQNGAWLSISSLCCIHSRGSQIPDKSILWAI